MKPAPLAALLLGALLGYLYGTRGPTCADVAAQSVEWRALAEHCARQMRHCVLTDLAPASRAKVEPAD